MCAPFPQNSFQSRHLFIFLWQCIQLWTASHPHQNELSFKQANKSWCERRSVIFGLKCVLDHREAAPLMSVGPAQGTTRPGDRRKVWQVDAGLGDWCRSNRRSTDTSAVSLVLAIVRREWSGRPALFFEKFWSSATILKHPHPRPHLGGPGGGRSCDLYFSNPFNSQVQKVHPPNLPKEKYLSEVVWEWVV